MSNARDMLATVLGKIDAAAEADRPIPEPTAPVGHRRLCIGMSVYDDFDGAYFTMQSIRMHHPEVADQISILVIDNHPEGLQSQALRNACEAAGNVRYLPFTGYRGTAVRDLLFREADADIVCCVDSHVLLLPGALKALIAYFDEHPDSNDLVQGPLYGDDLEHRVGTHFDPEWGAGMWGRWGFDDRLDDPDVEFFEIEMQGLGLFASRKDAWPGFNSRFRGFGGEEGYIHEKIRRAGGQAICLSALGWLHRFDRPSGIPYAPRLDDRVRNYIIAWNELGWDTQPVVDHFKDEYGDAPGIDDVIKAMTEQSASPFNLFDGIFSLNLDRQVERRAAAEHRYHELGIGWRVERVSATETPDDHHQGCALSWRQMIATAQHRGYRSFLGLEDDTVFLDTTLEVLEAGLAELTAIEWDVLFLGGVEWSGSKQIEGCTHLMTASYVTCTHALAVHERAYERLLDALPRESDNVETWITEHQAVDQAIAKMCESGELRGVILTPRVASQPALIIYEDGDKALADRYVI